MNLNAFDPYAKTNQSTDANTQQNAQQYAQQNVQQNTQQNVQQTAQQQNAKISSFLQSQRFPSGLIRSLLDTHTKQQMSFAAQKMQQQQQQQSALSTPNRFWILDNSLHMNVRDSHKIDGTFDKLQNVPNISRWEELRDCVAYQAQMATEIQTPLSFCLVNDPNPNIGPKLMNIGQNYFTNIQNELKILQNVMMNSQPQKNTSELATHLNFVRDLVLKQKERLLQQNQMITIVLATQGRPTNERGEPDHQQFLKMLRSFEGLPVYILVRLCTDDDEIIDYYNSLDRYLTSLNYDVMDDFFGEALEVYLRNPWLTYGLPLHRFRELGFWHGALDALDERQLTKKEMHQLCCLLFSAHLPDPEQNWDAFFHTLSMVMHNEMEQWNPVTQRKTPWINLVHLNRVYSNGTGSARNLNQHQSSPPFTTPQPNNYNPQQTFHQFNQQRPTFARHSSVQHQTTSQRYQNPHVVQQPHVSPPVTKNETGTSESSSSEVKKKILTTWALQPPNYQSLRPIEDLLSMVQSILPPSTQGVDDHDHFRKWKPITKSALVSGPFSVMKKAVRKMQLFLHPDKLPQDFTDTQKAFCKELWDVISDAWDMYKTKNNK